MFRLVLLLLFSTYSLLSNSTQLVGFEKEIPSLFSANHLEISSTYYKEGKQSLQWNYTPNDTLHIQLKQPLSLTPKLKESSGITLWIYNEKPSADSIRFEFLSPKGAIVYKFGFRLAAQGWRACWIGFKNMQKELLEEKISHYRLVAPPQEGCVYLDRLTFPVKNINDRTTPDMQMPTNNSLSYRDLWHWCRVWQWEQYQYDQPLPSALNANQKKELKEVEERLTAALRTDKISKSAIAKAYNIFNKANIKRSGSGFTGSPVVAPDELNRSKGEISWNDLETMLSAFAYDACYNHSKAAFENYFTVWDFAINQGFAFGSGMGTNHHYGYQIRKIYTTAWLMREAIWKSPNRDNILSTLIFWSALQETRKPYQYGRDELLDSWHTLLMAKTVSALLFTDERERSRALTNLSRWISGSLQYTPGTIGGIKPDGTTFHHGGFYPAYTTGVLAMIGQFISFTNQTEYELTQESRTILKSAFLSMRNYCNPYEWGIGLGGRHPFGGSMKNDDIAAFASLALSGDLSKEGNTFDHQLAADYLRLCDKDTPEARYFKKQGIRPALAPEGFFVYNYGSAGIFRRKEWMVTLKGYNTDVWGSEIYQKDNRYGRYQSYGSVQIMSEPSRIASGYDQNGWDWNRLPGTTTIHLPFELLDSPLPGTTMAHSKENFSGSSSLEGKNGMFAMKLMERDLKNFTPDFVARKSVFCFENRMIFLGSGISNSRADFDTETTLFQNTFQPEKSAIYFNKTKVTEVGYHQVLKAGSGQSIVLRDGYRNHYFVKEGEVQMQVAEQTSRHEKTRAETQGVFASAWINHGKAPQNGRYEYMVWIQPTEKELKKQEPLQSYKVLRHDNQAHIIYDQLTKTTAYALFDSIHLENDELFDKLPAETMVMRKAENGKIRISVCDPNLNISEKAYTTQEPSRPILKQLFLKGKWKVESEDSRINLSYAQDHTILKVTCQHGQPIEFVLAQ